MSKLFKDKNILNKSQNKFGKIAKDISEKHFKEWIEGVTSNLKCSPNATRTSKGPHCCGPSLHMYVTALSQLRSRGEA